ncbi:MAG: autotransporter-associated beta strand repeat-containing protein [Luteolibacter sp.]
MKLKSSYLPLTLVVGSLIISGFAHASTWTGGSGNWNSAVSPGWTTGGVPNAIGAVADYTSSGTTTVTVAQNVSGGVTAGSINYSGSTNQTWAFTLTNALTLNQDGAGSGFATISNANSSATTSNALTFASGGTITLADDLLISNTSASTNTTGAIQIISTVGGTGNITLSNVNTSLSQTGSIRLQTGVNTFTGSVLVQKGTTTFNVASAFGNSVNTITLGQSGQGSAALLTTSGGLANALTVASGSGGTLTLGRSGTGTSTFSGTVLLNGDVSLYSEVTNATGFLFSNVISGVGGMAKTGTGILSLTGANTFTGDTLISAGTLKIGNNLALQNGALDTSGAGVVNVTGFTTPTFGGLKGSTNLASVITTGYTAVTGLTLNPGTGVTYSYDGIIADGATGMSLTKSGAGKQTLNGANSYTGPTLISGGTLALGVSGSINTTSEVSLGTGGTFDVSAKSGGYSVGTLKGSGNVVGALTVSNQLAIGNSPGTTNFSSDLTLGASSTYVYEMTGGVAPSSGSADLGNVAGTLNITTGANLDLVELGTFTVGNKFTLFGYSTGNLTGTFSGLADDTTFADDLANTWQINYDDTSAGANGGVGTRFVTITAITAAVPEPSAVLLGAFGLLGLLRRRR